MDVAELMTVVDLFVLPSYREGFPRSVVEAVSLGLPIVTSNARGCDESIINCYNGFIVPTRDSAALYHSLKLLIQNKQLRETFAVNSRQLAIDKYDEDELVKRLLKVIESLN